MPPPATYKSEIGSQSTMWGVWCADSTRKENNYCCWPGGLPLAAEAYRGGREHFVPPRVFAVAAVDPHFFVSQAELSYAPSKRACFESKNACSRLSYYGNLLYFLHEAAVQ